MRKYSNVVERDQTAWELAAQGAKLREQGERLAHKIDLFLDRITQTEEHVAYVFAYRALSRRNENKLSIGRFVEPATCDDVNFSGLVVPFRVLTVHDHGQNRDS